MTGLLRVVRLLLYLARLLSALTFRLVLGGLVALAVRGSAGAYKEWISAPPTVNGAVAGTGRRP
jgi:hypothetical protein